MRIFKQILVPLAIILFLAACEEKKEEPNYEIVFSPAAVDFGLVELYTTFETTITITNSSSSSGAFMGLLEIMDTPGFSFDHPQEITLDRGDSRQVTLSFTPTAKQEYEGRFTLIDEGRNLEYFYELPIRGVGAGPVRFDVNITEMKFGLVEEGSFKDLILTLQNFINSGFNLEVTLSGLSGDFSLPDGRTAYSVAVNSAVDIPIRYTPTTPGSTGTLSVHHNSSIGANPINITLSGTRDNSAEVITLLTTGWNNFQNGNYTDALSGFQTAMVIVASSSLYDSLRTEVLLGRGWTHAYRRDYEKSVDDLLSVYQDYTPVAVQTKLDAAAGLAVVENLLTRYEQVIEHATYVLTNTFKYIFTYKESVDHKDVRLARAQAYFNTGDFVNTAKDLDILVPANKPHGVDPKDLLQALQNYSGGS